MASCLLCLLLGRPYLKWYHIARVSAPCSTISYTVTRRRSVCSTRRRGMLLFFAAASLDLLLGSSLLFFFSSLKQVASFLVGQRPRCAPPGQSSTNCLNNKQATNNNQLQYQPVTITRSNTSTTSGRRFCRKTRTSFQILYNNSSKLKDFILNVKK